MLRLQLLVALGMLACRNEPTGSASGSSSARRAPGAAVNTTGTGSAPHVQDAGRTAASAPTAPDSTGVPSAGQALASLGEAAGSCDWSNIVSTCFEAVGVTPSARDAAFRALAQLCKSVPTRDPCPRERRVGSCRTPDGFVEHYYAVGSRPYGASDARAECESRDGRWLG